MTLTAVLSIARRLVSTCVQQRFNTTITFAIVILEAVGRREGGAEDGELGQGAHRSTMDELTAWTQWADKVIVF